MLLGWRIKMTEVARYIIDRTDPAKDICKIITSLMSRNVGNIQSMEMLDNGQMKVVLETNTIDSVNNNLSEAQLQKARELWNLQTRI